MFPEARSCRSASLRLMFLKNHLGTRRRAEGTRDGALRAPSQSSDPTATRPLLHPYSRLGLQAVHQRHEVMGDQPLLARGERLSLPPLPVPAGTQRSETPPDPAQTPGGRWGTAGIRSLFQDAQLLAFPQPQVPVVLGLVVVQGHHQLVWGDKRRDRGGTGSLEVSQPPHVTSVSHLAWGSRGGTRARRSPGGLEPRSRCGSASARGQGPREPSAGGVWSPLGVFGGWGWGLSPLLTWCLLSGSMG